MDMTQESCRRFVEQLASSAPTPGGGGAAALVGAIGTALGHMAVNLTMGKKKYEKVREEISSINWRCTELEKELLDQVQADEKGFLPLAAAYRLSKDAPGYDQIVDDAKEVACQVPLKIMELCAEAIEKIAFVAEHGSRLAVSDAGSGAVCCKAAMQAAALTVFINTKNMADRQKAEVIEKQAQSLLDIYGAMADKIFKDVCGQFGQ